MIFYLFLLLIIKLNSDGTLDAIKTDKNVPSLSMVNGNEKISSDVSEGVNSSNEEMTLDDIVDKILQEYTLLQKSNHIVPKGKPIGDTIDDDVEASFEIPFLKDNDYANSKKLCELIQEEKPEFFEEQQEDIISGEEIYKHALDVIDDSDPNQEATTRKDLKNPFMCLDSDSFITKRLGVIEPTADEEYDVEKVGQSMKFIAEETDRLVLLQMEQRKRGDKMCSTKSCTRRDDPYSCITRIPVASQVCGTCWIFANMLHIEIIQCHKFNQIARDFSEGFYSDCIGRSVCSGGWTHYFLKQLKVTNTIRLRKDHPMVRDPNNISTSRCKLGDHIPNVFKGWNTKSIYGETLPGLNTIHPYRSDLLEARMRNYRLSDMDNLDKFFKYVVMTQGGLIIVLDVSQKFSPKRTKMMGATKYYYQPIVRCEGPPRYLHMIVMTGFGTYTSDSGQTREYYEFRNSWSVSWGDNGYVKFDRFGPPGCDGHVFRGFDYYTLDPPSHLNHTNLCTPALNDCKNGAKCFLVNPSVGNKRVCECLDGFVGETCDQVDTFKPHICTKRPCQNSGLCGRKGDDYYCVCKWGWVGKNCDKWNKCYTKNPCSATEKCKYDHVTDTLTCEPLDSKTTTTTVPVTTTKKIYTTTTSTSAPTTSYTYAPTTPYTHAPTTTYTYAPTTSATTDYFSNDCTKDPCMNGGVCLGDKSCSCAWGFTGTRCEYADKCFISNPCNRLQKCHYDGVKDKITCEGPGPRTTTTTSNVVTRKDIKTTTENVYTTSSTTIHTTHRKRTTTTESVDDVDMCASEICEQEYFNSSSQVKSAGGGWIAAIVLASVLVVCVIIYFLWPFIVKLFRSGHGGQLDA